ncbi:hypothetical protein [Tsukamurella pulmonis]|uniref:hypothetical protein n=1 Tax=Tsukamurella pulmonis TaxID=47312 RepID=UPI000A88E5B6|nr:hypothetical protein [Tsukamurella pulmonis]
MRRSLLCASAVLIATFAATGCNVHVTGGSTEQPASATALPACEGAATSEHGLGEAVRASISELSSLPPRFSTGEGTVTEDGGRLVVTMRLCGPGATDDQTRDAASAVSRSIGRSATLGSKVQAVHIENPDVSIRIVASPFDSARFSTGAGLADLRDQWRLDDDGR